MRELRDYSIVYIIKPDEGRLIGKIENIPPDSKMRVEHLAYFLSEGDLLRCFTGEGFVETYVIRKHDDEKTFKTFCLSSRVSK